MTKAILFGFDTLGSWGAIKVGWSRDDVKVSQAYMGSTEELPPEVASCGKAVIFCKMPVRGYDFSGASSVGKAERRCEMLMFLSSSIYLKTYDYEDDTQLFRNIPCTCNNVDDTFLPRI